MKRIGHMTLAMVAMLAMSGCVAMHEAMEDVVHGGGMHAHEAGAGHDRAAHEDGHEHGMRRDGGDHEGYDEEHESDD